MTWTYEKQYTNVSDSLLGDPFGKPEYVQGEAYYRIFKDGQAQRATCSTEDAARCVCEIFNTADASKP